MKLRKLGAALLVGGAVAWGMALAPLQWPRATLRAPTDANSAVALFFSSDASQLITTHFHPSQGDPPGNLSSVNLWDTASGARVAALTDRERAIHSVAYSPDGATIVGRQEDGKVLLWDRGTGKLRDRMWNDTIKDAHPGAPIAYTAEGRLLVQAGQNSTSMRYLDSGKVAFDVKDEIRDVHIVAIHHQHFYLAADNRQVVVLRLDTGERIAHFKSSIGVLDMSGALSPDGRSYATTTLLNPNRVLVWSADSEVALPPIPGLTSSWSTQSRLALANDAAMLAVYTTYHPRKWIYFGEESKEPRKRILILDPKTTQEIGRIDGGESAVFAPDGRTLAVTMENGNVQLWDVPMGRRWGWIGLAALAATVITFLLLTWRVRRRSARGGKM